MDSSRLQWSLTAFLAVVATCALNFWLFRFGVLWGLLGLSVTKHVGVAWLCQALGVDRKTPDPVRPRFVPEPSGRHEPHLGNESR